MKPFRRILGCCSVLLLLAPSAASAVDEHEDGGQGVAYPIINGSSAGPDGHPWMAALTLRPRSGIPLSELQFCGGALIDPLWVVTAAHCVTRTPADGFQVVLGTHDLNSGEGTSHVVAEVKIHPLYETARIDIALLRLAAPSDEQPLLLADTEVESRFYSNPTTVYGWGLSSQNLDLECDLVQAASVANADDYRCEVEAFLQGTSPSLLQTTELTLFSRHECDERFLAFLAEQEVDLPDPDSEDDPSGYYDYLPLFLCLWDPAEQSSVCFGDSGGPLVGRTDDKEYLLGVASSVLTQDCSVAFQINRMARVSAMRGFITETMGGSPGMSFEDLCPPAPFPDFWFEEATGGKRLTIQWESVAGATGYTLFYSHYPIKNGFVGKLKLPASATEFSKVLKSGSKYLAALQVRSAACDSPMSALEVVEVP